MSVQEFTKKKEEKEVKQTDEKSFAVWQTIEDISKAINKLSAIKSEIETLNNSLNSSREDIKATLNKFTKENANISKEYYILEQCKSLLLFFILLVLTFILNTKVKATVFFTIVYILEAVGIILSGYNLLNLFNINIFLKE
jgi:hypothetical protein